MIERSGGPLQMKHRPARAMPALLCLLLAMPIWAVNGEMAGTGAVAVLFYYSPEEYYWGNASVTAGADAIEVSGAAAEAINRGFAYDNATGAATVGGLGPGPNDTWKWTLLSWDPQGARWVPWTGDPHGLKPQPGGAMAWSPDDTAYPAPDPLSMYPWPMDRCTPTRRGETLSPAPATNLTFWTAAVGGYVTASPCVADGKVFVLSGNDPSDGQGTVLFCLDELTGTRLWRRTLVGMDVMYRPEYSSPAYAEGKIFFGTSDGVLHALNASDGSEAWEYTVDEPHRGNLCSPVIAGRSVIFTAGTNAIYCLGLDGGFLWKRVPTGGSSIHNSGPAVLDGKVVYGEDSGNLTCLDASNGSLIWSIDLGKPYMLTPAVSLEGYAFVATSDAYHSGMTLFSIFLRDGVQQWNATYSPSTASPAQAAGGLFVGTGGGIAAYHPDRGTMVWELGVGIVDASPVVARGFVYYAAAPMLYIIGCVRVGGQPEWTMAVDGRFNHAPAIADGRLFAVSSNGTVLCLGRPPQALLAARLSAPGKMSPGSSARITVAMNNTGEAAAIFTVYLTVDGNRTSLKKGPLEIGPGGSRTIVFEWKALGGKHRLGLYLDGANATFNETAVNVSSGPQGCAIAYYIPLAAGAALLVPFIACFRKDKRGEGA